MKTNNIYILLIAILLALTACEKEVTNIKLPQASSKLVVTSFISPQDTMLWVSVIESVPAIGKINLSSEDIRNATVSISDGERSINLLYDIQARTYTADAETLPIIPGKTYFLEVTDTKGRKAEASCTVPVTAEPALEIAIDSANGRYGDYMEYFMLMKWQDTPGEINYYRIFAEISTNQEGGTQYTWPVSFESDGSGYSNIRLYSDNRLDGAKFSSPKGILFHRSNSSQFPRFPAITTLYSYLLSTDEHYYHYHQSLMNNYNVDGNPFAEPVLLYSNVNGGLGVFAAYNRTTASMPLK
jgi:hypothetical protein